MSQRAESQVPRASGPVHDPRGAPCAVAAWLTAALCLAAATHAQVQSDWMHARVRTPNEESALAFDEARGRLVLCAFASGRLLEGFATWESDGTHWLHRAPMPSPGTSTCVSYDAARARTVGFTSSALERTTWTWDGAVWFNQRPAHQPSSRRGTAMTDDLTQGRVVLFAGYDETFPVPRGYVNDTWTWDGTDWTLQSPPVSPPSRERHALAYDAVRQELVLFGGFDGANPLADTWTWNGTTWTQRVVSGPPARSRHAMAYDAARQQVVLFGGHDGTRALADTWIWNGASWTNAAAGGPPARYQHGMAYDSARQRITLCGGMARARAALSDAWTWDGAQWSLLAPAAAPPALSGQGLAGDPSRRHIVMFGGWDREGSYTAATWVWNGTAWQERMPARSPPARAATAMTFDGVNRHVLMFGGFGATGGGSGVLADTWLWDGANWSQRVPTASPPARERHGLAWDGARGRALLFGGRSGSTSLGDTWEWDGSTWADRSPTAGPGPRHDHALAFDEVRGQVVLFGGRDGGLWLQDTWLWDGSSWIQAAPLTRPAARAGQGMAYDPARQRVVLFGGTNANSYLSDTWEWDGNDWRAVATGNNPFNRSHAPLAYDATRERILLVGGAIDPLLPWLPIPWADTWLFGPLVPATVAAVPNTTGCGGSGGVPTLAGTHPSLGNGAFTLDILGTPPAATCAFGFAAARRDTLLGNCVLHLQDPILVTATASSRGFATHSVAVPMDLSLLGVPLYCQGFAVDATAPPVGVVFTRPLQMRIGD